jgi:plasmid stabilization system protein ParE
VTFQVVIRKPAALDIAAVEAWYEGERPGLGREFLDEVEASLLRISRRADAYPFVYRDAKRAIVRRFPYNIYFRVRGLEARIIAVVHQRRNPQTWQRRVT